jgi:hypothetical protein
MSVIKMTSEKPRQNPGGLLNPVRISIFSLHA